MRNEQEYFNFHWNPTPLTERSPFCTLIGSLKFMPKINETYDRFTAKGITILAPQKGEVAQEVNGYKVLDIDGDTHPIDLEVNYIDRLLSSDAAYIVNPGGYIGATSVAELALARKFLIPVLAMEPLDPKLDENGRFAERWRKMCEEVPVAPIGNAIEVIKNSNHPIYKDRGQEFLPLLSDELEKIVIHVLGVDWLKHRGLGAVVNWIDDAWNNRLIPRNGPVTRISEYRYNSYTNDYTSKRL